MPPDLAHALQTLASHIDPERAERIAWAHSSRASSLGAAITTLLFTAFPPFETLLSRESAYVDRLASEGWRSPRTRDDYLALMRDEMFPETPSIARSDESTPSPPEALHTGPFDLTPSSFGVREKHGDSYPPHARASEVIPIMPGEKLPGGAQTRPRTLSTSEVAVADDIDVVRRAIRRVTHREQARIALRELLPSTLGGAEINETARELSELAEAGIEIALAEATQSTEQRMGAPLATSGDRSRMVVLGMGKLGGRELNAGSDVDLLYLYDTDDGASEQGETLHAFWSRVARRVTQTLEEATEDGVAWRVDLRLRPEGTQGPIANSFLAAERYYETWGRPWERAALLRARPVAGAREDGNSLLDELVPFVFPRRVDPSIADEMVKMVERSRQQLSRSPERDLKLGPGGIREIEFFAQALQLIWGGREPSVRVKGTPSALARLRDRGLVTHREWDELTGAYLVLRRLEHRVQWSTGVQTHDLPTDTDDMGRLARSLGYEEVTAMMIELDRLRGLVTRRFADLRLGATPVRTPVDEVVDAVVQASNDPTSEGALTTAVSALLASNAAEVSRELMALARRPDHPLGANTAVRYPTFCRALVEGILDAADPELAARTVRSLFGRISDAGLYIKPLAEEPRRVRRLAAVFGASAFVGSTVANHPQLRDRVLFHHEPPTAEQIRKEFREATAACIEAGLDDPETFVGTLREVKVGSTLEVALADLSNTIRLSHSLRLLSAIADGTVESTLALEAHRAGLPSSGLTVLALGKLGGEEIGYGADLDLVFVFDPAAAPAEVDPYEHFARRAQRIVRWIATPHARGAGYEIDVRLRPSGSQGLLVTSLDAFARYHEVNEGHGEPATRARGAAFWERMALLRTRVVAGDRAVGDKALAIAHRAAYERGAASETELRALRQRTEDELGKARPGRIHVKAGAGGLLDIEFAVQWLQMRHGNDPRVRSTNTERAMRALVQCGYLSEHEAEPLREGYRLLRRLEQRMRIVHNASSTYVDEGAEGLRSLSRRMGYRDGPQAVAPVEMMSQIRTVMSRVRKAFDAVIHDENGETPLA